MKYKIKYLPKANQDILLIDEFLSEYPNKAKRLFQDMDKKLQMLRDMPNMWPVYIDKMKYRKMVLEDFLLFYSVDDENLEVKVYRVLYNKMDIKKQI